MPIRNEVSHTDEEGAVPVLRHRLLCIGVRWETTFTRVPGWGAARRSAAIHLHDLTSAPPVIVMGPPPGETETPPVIVIGAPPA